ncbi:MAG TPA: hypothetical protein VJC12_00795 [Candidatus Paceibacterota bacterium]
MHKMYGDPKVLRERVKHLKFLDPVKDKKEIARREAVIKAQMARLFEAAREAERITAADLNMRFGCWDD